MKMASFPWEKTTSCNCLIRPMSKATIIVGTKKKLIKNMLRNEMSIDDFKKLLSIPGSHMHNAGHIPMTL